MEYEILCESYRGRKKGDTITLRDIPDADLDTLLHKKHIAPKQTQNKAIKAPTNTKGVKDE